MLDSVRATLPRIRHASAGHSVDQRAFRALGRNVRLQFRARGRPFPPLSDRVLARSLQRSGTVRRW